MSVYEPLPAETLGAYLYRLRTATNKSLEAIAALSEVYPQTFTGVWLSKVEKDAYEQVGGERLRTLATIYTSQLAVAIQPEWLLTLAGYNVETTPEAGSPDLTTLLQNPDLAALLRAAAKLVELGHPGDVRHLLDSAQRLLRAHAPGLTIEDIYQDPDLSVHVKKFMREVGL